MSKVHYIKPYTGEQAEMDIQGFKPLPVRYVNLTERKISKEMCEKWKVGYLDNYLGQPCLAFEYHKNGVLAGYHIKPKDKKCLLMGNIKECDMYGSWLHGEPEGRTLVITEGHEDAIVCNIVIGDAGINFTTLPYGNRSVKDFIDAHYTLLSRYSNLCLCFDMDAPGADATRDFLTNFNQIGKVKIAKLPLKDANDMLKAGRVEELKWAILKAETFKPPHIVDMNQLLNKFLEKPKIGLPWPWPSMTELTYGYFPGKLMVIGGPEQAGKTYFITNLLSHFAENKIKSGIFYLEEDPLRTAHKLVGIQMNKQLTDPSDPYWDEKELKEEFNKFAQHHFLFDPTKGIELDEVINSIYYFVNVQGAEFIVIDNMTILAENKKIGGKVLKESEFIDEAILKFDRLRKELKITICLVAHVNNDTLTKQVYVSTSPKNVEKYKELSSKDVDQLINKPGMTWETGRIASMEHLRLMGVGRRLADWVIVLARNSMSQDDKEFRTVTINFAKARDCKRGASRKFELVLNPLTGRLEE